MAAGALVGGQCAGADAGAQQPPPSRNFRGYTPSGNYLAGRQANILRDSAAASAYYRAALRADPKNPEILELALSIAHSPRGTLTKPSSLPTGCWLIDKNNRNTRLVLGARAIKQENYTAACAQLSQAARGPITDLIATPDVGMGAIRRLATRRVLSRPSTS